MKTLEKIMEVNPFESQKSEKKPESEKKVIIGDKQIEKTLEQYQRLNITGYWIKDEQRLSRLEPQTLTPAQIDMLLQHMVQTTNKEKLEHELSGTFLTDLIQKSYDAGYNDFILDPERIEIHRIGYELEGKPENKIKGTVKGNVGIGLGNRSENCIFNVKGDTMKSCGHSSENSIFNIEGDSWYHCGNWSRNSTYNIKGSIGNDCGKHSENCTFTSSNKKTYEKMKEVVPKEGWFGAPTDNKVRYTGK